MCNLPISMMTSLITQVNFKVEKWVYVRRSGGYIHLHPPRGYPPGGWRIRGVSASVPSIVVMLNVFYGLDKGPCPLARNVFYGAYPGHMFCFRKGDAHCNLKRVMLHLN